MGKGKGGKRKVATQMAETPTLYGKDAEAVFEQIHRKPSEEKVQQLIKKLEKDFEGMKKRGF